MLRSARRSGEWLSERQLTITTINTEAYEATQEGAAAAARVTAGSGLYLTVVPDLTTLRLQQSWRQALATRSDGSTIAVQSLPVTSRLVPLAPCATSNETAAATFAVTPQVSYVTPIEFSATRVVCLAPSRPRPVSTDLDIALNGQDFHSVTRAREPGPCLSTTSRPHSTRKSPPGPLPLLTMCLAGAERAGARFLHAADRSLAPLARQRWTHFRWHCGHHPRRRA